RPGALEDVEPAGGLRSGHVIRPEPTGEQQRQQPRCEMSDERRGTDPIADAARLLAAPQSFECAARVVVARTVDVARAHDEVLRQQLPDERLTGQLRASV